MKATLDLPDERVRRIKIEAAQADRYRRHRLSPDPGRSP
jgi:hypothetical protein